MLRCAPTCMAEGAALKGVDGVVFPGIDISDRYLQKGKSLLYCRSSGPYDESQRANYYKERLRWASHAARTGLYVFREHAARAEFKRPHKEPSGGSWFSETPSNFGVLSYPAYARALCSPQ